ncbi:hypothetical protein [Azospirillum argentinense]|uniref:hypothetical protein n=1 Tax=Azospirillum argentinense TaxID=2970906 RepID=UPI0032DF0AB3
MEAEVVTNDDLDRFAYEVGIRLEAARMTLGFRPAEMCELMGCARNTYTQYIRGDSQIASYRLKPIVTRGIPSDYLLFGIKAAVPAHLLEALEANEAQARIDRETPTNKGRRG